MFSWSDWSVSGRRKTRLSGNNSVVENSYQEEVINVILVGGNGVSTGNVFVTYSAGYYGPVCNDYFTDQNNDIGATVVCKELGFTRGVAQKVSTFGNVPARFAMDDVKCTGSER